MVDNSLREHVESRLEEKFEWQEAEDGLNSIYILEGDRDLIVKEHTNEENDIEWFRSEPRMYELLSGTRVPTPEIVYTDFSEESHPNSYYVMEKLEGVNPESLKEEWGIDQWKDLMRQYGRYLAMIHDSRSFDTYGLLGAEEGELMVLDGAERWSWSFNGIKDSLISIIENKWENPPDLEPPGKEEVHRSAPDDPGAVPVHSDNRLDNLLVVDGEINGFLDWSHPRTGAGEYDLARAEYLLLEWDLEAEGEELEELRNSLISGYESVRELDNFREMRQIYRYITVLWIAAGFPNWGQQYSEEKREDLRQDIIRRLEKETPE